MRAFTLLRLSILLSLVPAIRAAENTPAPPAAPVLIMDFRTAAPGIFSYDTWKDRIAISKAGLVIMGSQGARGQGGMGRAIEPALDLSRDTFIEVALGVGALNEVPHLTVALNDSDGTQVSALVRIDQIMPQPPVWFRIPVKEFKRVSGQDGSDSKMDWTKVAQWHLQGDWTTAKPLHVLFIALRAQP